MRILIVEDDPRTRELLRQGLGESGHACALAADGQEALSLLAADRRAFDLVLLDVMMPNLDGWETLRRMRSERLDTPVVMLTARHDLDERVHGLKLGADDYLIKPFAWSELLARIDAVGRRSQTVLRHGDLEIDLRERLVHCAGLRIELSAREFAVLEHLAREPGRPLSRRQILRDVWGIEFEPGTNVLAVTVSRLRRRLGRSRRTRIQHVPEQGYLLEVDPPDA